MENQIDLYNYESHVYSVCTSNLCQQRRRELDPNLMMSLHFLRCALPEHSHVPVNDYACAHPASEQVMMSA